MHYPDTAFPVNNTAGDAPLIVFCDKRAEEAHITVSEVGGVLKNWLQCSCSNFILTFLFLDVQGISRDLTSALQKVTYLDTLSELLAHMASLHTVNVACYLDSFDTFFCLCFSTTGCKSAPIAVPASSIVTVVWKENNMSQLWNVGTEERLCSYHSGITCGSQQ